MRKDFKEEVVCDSLEEIAEVLNYNIDILEKRVKKIDKKSKKRMLLSIFLTSVLFNYSIAFTYWRTAKINTIDTH